MKRLCRDSSRPYYALSEYYRPIPELESWLRRRVRCCYWKQWRWCRRRVRELLKLGTSLRTAIQAGLSRKAESDETRPRCLGRNILVPQSRDRRHWPRSRG